MTLPLEQVDVAGLAEAVDDSSWDQRHYLDLDTGQLEYWFEDGDNLDANNEPIDLEEQNWLEVEKVGSRSGYRDMEVFTETVADQRLRDQLARALDGKGAFRRFRDVLHRDADPAVLAAWRDFSDARARARALDWLGRHELVDAAELDQAITLAEASEREALGRVGVPTSGCRLVLLNGMPGAGKSTLAERYRSEHPGVLVVEADKLRDWIGGDPADHAETARELSLALVRTHLDNGYDVVVPQLVAKVAEVERFAAVAEETGAELVEVVIHGGTVDSRVPDEAVDHLVEYAEGLADVVARRPDTHRLATRHGDVDSAYSALVDLLDPDLPA